jgi:hypothetical protein
MMDWETDDDPAERKRVPTISPLDWQGLALLAAMVGLMAFIIWWR